MPKIHSHDDTKIDAEFENLYTKADMYVVDINTPKNPRSGMMWFDPSTGALKIFKNIQQGWQTI